MVLNEVTMFKIYQNPIINSALKFSARVSYAAAGGVLMSDQPTDVKLAGLALLVPFLALLSPALVAWDTWPLTATRIALRAGLVVGEMLCVFCLVLATIGGYTAGLSNGESTALVVSGIFGSFIYLVTTTMLYKDNIQNDAGSKT